MWVIAEGVDCAGKTTLLDAVADVIKTATGREPKRTAHGKPDQMPYFEYIRDYHWYEPGTPTDLVTDRHFVGERIYGPLFRGSTSLSMDGFYQCAKYVASRKGVLVFVEADKDTVLARMQERGEDLLKPNDVAHVIMEYRHYAQLLIDNVPDLKVLRVDGSRPAEVNAAMVALVAALEEGQQ